jgi:hypothetical protein
MNNMKLFTGLLLASVLALGACTTEATRAANEAYYSDKPAQITCYTYGALTFDGWSTGKVIYDEGGRITFVDNANKRLTTIEGDCRIVYQGDEPIMRNGNVVNE